MASNLNRPFKPSYPNSIPINQRSSKQNYNNYNAFSSQKRGRTISFPKKATIFIGGISKSASLASINQAFKMFGPIKGFAWKQGRTFVFLKFSDIVSASNAISGMNRARFFGKALTVSYAKSELIIGDTKQNKVPEKASSVDSKIMLTVEQDIKLRMKKAALIIDKEPIHADKLFNWLRSREISIKAVSTWGIYGYIVECCNDEGFKRMNMGPTLSSSEFLLVQPMVNRSLKFSRFVRLEVKGCPFECSSIDSLNLIVGECGGHVVHVDSKSSQLKNAESLFVLAEINDPAPIQRYVTVSVSPTESCKVWVQEVKESMALDDISDPFIDEYNLSIQGFTSPTSTKIDDKVRGEIDGERRLDSPVAASNPVDCCNSGAGIEDGEINVDVSIKGSLGTKELFLTPPSSKIGKDTKGDSHLSITRDESTLADQESKLCNTKNTIASFPILDNMNLVNTVIDLEIESCSQNGLVDLGETKFPPLYACNRKYEPFNKPTPLSTVPGQSSSKNPIDTLQNIGSCGERECNKGCGAIRKRGASIKISNENAENNVKNNYVNSKIVTGKLINSPKFDTTSEIRVKKKAVNDVMFGNSFGGEPSLKQNVDDVNGSFKQELIKFSCVMDKLAAEELPKSLSKA